jgi:hypothetical protein
MIVAETWAPLVKVTPKDKVIRPDAAEATLELDTLSTIYNEGHRQHLQVSKIKSASYSSRKNMTDSVCITCSDF